MDRILYAGLFFVFVFSTHHSNAQFENIGARMEPTFKEIVEFQDKKFQKKIKRNKGKTKGIGYTPYNRWKGFWEYRLGENGKFSEIYGAIEAAKRQKADCTTEADWNEIGPFNYPLIGNHQRGIGRANFVRLHPDYDGISNTTLFCGGHGGLWRSTDNGDNWENLNSDAFDVSSCSDVVVMKTTSDDQDAGADGEILLTSTGIAQVSSNPYRVSSGLKRSTDNGISWESINLESAPWNTGQLRTVTKLVVDPGNNQRVYACVSRFSWTPGQNYFDPNETSHYLSQVFVSENYGLTWMEIYDGFYIEDFEFKPDNPSVFYLSGHLLVRCTRNVNGSYIFDDLSANLGNLFYFDLNEGAHSKRMKVEVSPQHPDNIYVMAVNLDSVGPGWWRSLIWKSTNQGSAFQVVSRDSLGDRMSSWIHVAFEVSPINDQHFYTGSVKSYQSTNGGASWTHINSVHDDTNDAVATDDGEVFFANDAGIFRSLDAGQNWSPTAQGLSISWVYDFGMTLRSSSMVPNYLQAGFLDVTCMTYRDDSDWFQPTGVGGDGLECIVDPVNPNIMYNESQFGGTRKSTNAGNSFSGYGVGSGPGAFRTPMKLDPNDHTKLCVGKHQLFCRSGNTTEELTNLSPVTIGNENKITAFNIAKTNSNIIYTAYETGVPVFDQIAYDNWWDDPNARVTDQLFKTSDGGQTWTDITPTDLIENRLSNITSIEIHPNNPDKIWITFTRYFWQNRVFKSEDGGATWTNYSQGLPAMPANKIVISPNVTDHATCEHLYLATDLGIYYRSADMAQWECFDDGLPNIPVLGLEIDPYQKIIRSATAGRGIWESNLHPADRIYGTSDFEFTTSCLGNGSVEVIAIALENWPNSQWELFEMNQPDPNNPVCGNPEDFTCDENTISGSINTQQGNSATFIITDPTKHYYIKHSNWGDCHQIQDVRKYVQTDDIVPFASFHLENGLGVISSIFCDDVDVYLDGRSSRAENSYLVELASRPLNSTNTFNALSSLGWQPGEVGIINLSQIFAIQGMPQVNLLSGFEYEVTLSVRNDECGIVDVTTRTFSIHVDVGLDASFKILGTHATTPSYLTTKAENDYVSDGAQHEWHLFYSPTNVPGPYRYFDMQTGPQAFLYADLPGYYIIIHKIFTGCEELCFAAVWTGVENPPFDCSNIGGCGDFDCSLIDDLYAEPVCPPNICKNARHVNNEVELFPNPSSGLLNIVIENAEALQLELLDANGKCMHQEFVKGPVLQANLDHLQSGLYFIKVSQDGDKPDVFRWVKE